MLLELFIPDTCGKIDLATTPTFRSLFNVNIEDVSRHLVEKNLVLLDHAMPMGYRRYFYEITKGRMPSAKLETEEEKIVSMLAHKIKEPGLFDQYFPFVKEKGKEPVFRFNMIFNAYVIITMLKEVVSKGERFTEKEATISTLDFFLKSLNNTSKQPCWLELFPTTVQSIAKTLPDITLDLMQQIYTIKSYLSDEPSHKIKDFAGKTLRINGIKDKTQGYHISHSCSLEELLEKLVTVKNHVKEELFWEIFAEWQVPRDLPLEDALTFKY